MTSTDTRIYRMDGPKEIETDQLLFWPNNPRLKISDFKEVKYTEQQLLDPRNQQKIYELLCQHEQNVDELIRSMSNVGFMREKAPIVMELKGKQKYLVLEGNRRLTAIRTLLSETTSTISRSNRESLLLIPCWLFVHGSNTIPLNTAISRMVAEQHLKGQKPHTKIQQAHMLYNAYMGFLLEESGKEEFHKKPEIIKRSANFFDIGYEEFELELAVVRLYKQLTETGYEVSHKVRERLTWVYKNPRHFKRNFGYQETTFRLDNPGLERYHDIFIKEGCAVRNPTLFNKFINVMRYGESYHIEILRDAPKQLSQIEQMLLEERSDQRFLLELQRIEKKLQGLKINEYRQSNEEDRLINSIYRLVNHKLIKLCRIKEQSQGSEGVIDDDINSRDEFGFTKLVRSLLRRK